jgi:putative membrane protein
MTDTELQYGAYSQNGNSGPLKRYAQRSLPRSKQLLEYAKRLAGGR